MPFSLRKLSRLHLIALLVVAMIGMATFGFGFRDWFSRSAPIAVTQQQIGLEAAAADTPTPIPITVEPLTLTEQGFFPRTFSHPKGRFILVVNNRTRLDELNLTLSRDNGSKGREKQKDAKVPHHQPDWNDEFDLTPGDYVLTEASNPKWECQITITAK